MFVLDSVAVADTFPSDGASGGAQLVAQNGSNGGFAAVAGADVYVQLGYFSNGMLTWTPQVRAGIGNIVLAAGTRGIRFRNAVAGSVATVSAALSEPAEPPMQLTAGGVATPSTGGGVPTVGDFKHSAQAASHADPSGTGTWYLCDGTALPVAETALIALIGASTLDARGRIPVTKGTHADVSTIGNNDGAAVANRRPKHYHTTVIDYQSFVGGASPALRIDTGVAGTASWNTDLGSAGNIKDTPAYIVPGSLFVYGSGS